MKFVSHIVDRFRTSELYLHHSGFGDWITVNLHDERHKLPGMKAAIHEDVGESKYCDIHAGWIGVYVELFVEADAPEGGYTRLAFEHHDVKHRRRIDLFLTRGADRSHIRARLTANQDEVLFDGAVPLFVDSMEKPFVLDAARG